MYRYRVLFGIRDPRTNASPSTLNGDGYIDIVDIVMDIASAAHLIEHARLQANLSQRELARRAATSQPALARLEAGDADPRFGTLLRLVEAAGFNLRIELVAKATTDAVVDAYKRDVDRTLLRENLRKTVDRRLRDLADAQHAMAELRAAMLRAKRNAL